MLHPLKRFKCSCTHLETQSEGLSKAEYRAGRELFFHCYTMEDVELGQVQLTVRNVTVTLLTGPFSLRHQLHLQTVIKLIFQW
jgi:hypothetical protein